MTGRRPLAIRGAAALTAGAAVAAVALTATSTTTPAFALTRHRDGSITVRINRASGVAGADRRLAAMGVHAHLTVVTHAGSFPSTVSCVVIPGARADLTAMRADAARDAAEDDASDAAALRAGAAAIANGTVPDIVRRCTISGVGTGTGDTGNTGAR